MKADKLYKIKDEAAFKAIKGKIVRIQSTIPNTIDGVVVVSNNPHDRDLSGGYKYRLCDLEPWEPKQEPPKVKDAIRAQALKEAAELVRERSARLKARAVDAERTARAIEALV